MTVWGVSAHLAGDVVVALRERGLPVTDLRTEQPALEDVFLRLVSGGGERA
ncbi:MAG: hypothetical protein AB1445_16000 [Bacillota bacterium]